MSTAPVLPSVTVVMPTFNRRAYLTRMLEPLLAEPDALEIVVVVGAMPVSGGSHSNAPDYPRVMYANEYRRRGRMCSAWSIA